MNESNRINDNESEDRRRLAPAIISLGLCYVRTKDILSYRDLIQHRFHVTLGTISTLRFVSREPRNYRHKPDWWKTHSFTRRAPTGHHNTNIAMPPLDTLHPLPPDVKKTKHCSGSSFRIVSYLHEIVSEPVKQHTYMYDWLRNKLEVQSQEIKREEKPNAMFGYS